MYRIPHEVRGGLLGGVVTGPSVSTLEMSWQQVACLGQLQKTQGP